MISDVFQMEVAIRGNNLSAPTKSVFPSSTGVSRDDQHHGIGNSYCGDDQ